MNTDREAAANLWRHTLTQISSTFGRLFYLASLRDANSGLYQHFGLAQRFNGQQADEVLRDSHHQVFSQWLAFQLIDQKADLEEYFSGLDTDVSSIVRTWMRLAPYANCVPAEARAVERELFLADMANVLQLLRNEHAVSFPDPDA